MSLRAAPGEDRIRTSKYPDLLVDLPMFKIVLKVTQVLYEIWLNVFHWKYIHGILTILSKWQQIP